MTRTALVIGGGLIGTTSAWYLAERGFKVTVVERREGSALETSFANGGLITPSQSDPWNAPGTFAHLLRWLGREDSPLLLRPRALPGMWRWGLQFLRTSRPGPWRHATEANLRLGLYSVACLRTLRRELCLEYDGLAAGTLKVFRDAASFRRSCELAASLAPLGLNHRVMETAAACELEPLLRPLRSELVGAMHYPDDECGDAHQFSRALEECARSAGVRFLFNTEVRRLRAQSTHIGWLETGQGELSADVYVLAAASASPALVQPLGLRLPIYPVKGYSVSLPAVDWHRRLGLPLVDFERKLVITPLGSRLRIAGTAEFNGFDTANNPRRGAALLAQALALVPELAEQTEAVQAQHWAGLRPMTCDGPPVLGASPYTNLFFNTGHGPLGWTLGAGSARVVADLAAGRTPAIGLGDFAYARFRN